MNPSSTKVDLPSPRAPQALTVAQVLARIRGAVAQQFPSPVWIEGEVSNCSFPASGHIYFSLVDPQATDRFGQRLLLPCAFFRGHNQHLKFTLTDGLKVLCFGEVTTYEAKGQYQLKVVRVEPQGKGALQLAFEQLKKRLGAEGLFEEARKRPMPRTPDRVGIITSPSGSAIHDMVSKLRGVFHLIILPVKVQGEGAAEEIVEALELANRLQLAEVLIVGRGGGSIEDLWAFNEEPVARAIARSRIPVISAVGHQDDWTIADFVADLRASTPTDAAKLLAHEQEAFAQECRDLIERLVDGMRLTLDEQDGALGRLAEQLRLLHPLHQLAQHLQRATQLDAQLAQSMRHALDRAQRSLETLAGRLQALSPLAVLERGYSVTFALPACAAHGASDGGAAGRPERRVVSDAASLHAGDALETRLRRGRVMSTVTATEMGDGADA